MGDQFGTYPRKTRTDSDFSNTATESWYRTKSSLQ